MRQIQGTLNGIGERCGNANLVTLIATLALKPVHANRFETGVGTEALSHLTLLSHKFDEILNRAPDAQSPYVGASAFATKAGIHASAIAKEPQTYEHVPPESVGNRRRVMVSDQGGKSNFIARTEAARHRRAQGRSEPRQADRHRQGTRGAGLCLRGGGGELRIAGALHPRHRAGISSRSKASDAWSSAASTPSATSSRCRKRW